MLLEIVSGIGQYVVFCSVGLLGWMWQFSEVDDIVLVLIVIWCVGLECVCVLLWLDVFDMFWVGVLLQVDVIYCVNMIYILFWVCIVVLLWGVVWYLVLKGLLLIYGFYFVDGEFVVLSNFLFDVDLCVCNLVWGLCCLVVLEVQVVEVGFCFCERLELFVNNMLLVWVYVEVVVVV